MPLSGSQLQTLRDEIDNDPVSLGYAGKTDPEIADVINSLATGRIIPSDAVLPTSTIFDAFVPSEYLNAMLITLNVNILTHLLSMGTIVAGSDNVRDALIQVFGVGSQTINNLQPLRTKLASRAQELGLPTVTPSDVANARRL